MLTASQYVARLLERWGVRHVFGVGGANVEDLYHAIHCCAQVRCVVAKHEFSAATMADGYVRAGMPLGVVLATSGGGALNLIPALGEAYASCVPILAIVGQPPTSLEGRGAFQDGSGCGGSIDAQALFAAVAVFCRRVARAEDLPHTLHDALAAACGERPGPAVLLLPKDVQRATIDPRAIGFGHLPPALRRPASLDRVQAATTLLTRARSIFMIAGDGVARHDARDELSDFVQRLDARVAVAPDARDAFDNRDPRFAGVVGAMGHPQAAKLLAQADLCVAVGTRLPHLARAGMEAELAQRPLVHVHFEPSFVQGAPHVEIIGNVKGSLSALCACLSPRAAPAIAPRDAEQTATTFLPGAQPAALGFREALEAVADALSDDANVFIDAGNTGASAVHWLRSPSRGRTVVALGMGGMGYSFGAGIGAAFANGRRTYVLAGDGAFYMHGLEVHTAIEHRLPVAFVLFNNDAHAMCFTREHLYFGGDYSYNLFQRADLAAGMAAMFPSLTVLPARTPAEIREGLGGGLFGPALMSIRVDAREVPPFAPFLEAMTGIDENRPRKAG
jgi:acetolactate synthase-1/2/3 large subunit